VVPGKRIRFLRPSGNHTIIPSLFYKLLSNRYSIFQGYVFARGVFMQIRKVGSIVLASAFTIFLSTGFAVAQDSPKQEMKAAGTDTKNAAKDTGHAVSTGSKKAYNKSSSGTKTAADKTATGTKKVYHKTASGTETAADKTVNGTKTVGKDIGHGTKVAAKDTANGTKKVGDKIAGKPDPK
jgi:hypothetical protein